MFIYKSVSTLLLLMLPLLEGRTPAFAHLHQKKPILEDKECFEENSRRRRMLLGFSILATSSIKPAFAKDDKDMKPTVAMDIMGSPILAPAFLNKIGNDDRSMVQGIKGDPTYLIVNRDRPKIETYALNAECTHLGCVVPWDSMQSKFVCPCHGSQYDSIGRVLRGPAPGPLKLAKVRVDEEGGGSVLLEPWTDVDFRTGEKPWWM